MLNKNVQTFIACDREYAEADIVLFGAPLIPQPPTAPARVSEAVRCVRNPKDLRPTVLIKTKT
jgi:hypothetical protein